jgi:DNA-binding IclR family transcriptional regulator
MTDSHVESIDRAALGAVRDASGETASLHIRAGDRRICIAEELSNQPISVSFGIGQSHPLMAGAAGKAIMSLTSDDQVERLIALEPNPGRPRIPRRTLLASVRLARERGEVVPGFVEVEVAVPRPLPAVW